MLYMSYDITSLLTPGQNNTFGLELGLGYRDASKYPNRNHDSPPDDVYPMVGRVLLSLLWANGQKTVVVSDDSWWAGQVCVFVVRLI
jgi:hypothetical protein